MPPDVVMASRLEINFNRLLNRCEVMAAEKKKGDWRLEKYVGALQEQLSDLRKATSRPTQETLAEYSRKVEFLKGLIEVEKLPSASEKAMAADLLTPAPVSAVHATPSRELHLQAKSRFQCEMRDELLGKPDTDSGLRLRGAAGGVSGQGDSGGNTGKDLDVLLKHHQQTQEKLAQEMVSLAHNLKENATTANKIVKEDNRRLAESQSMADKNFGKLKVESGRLDQHVQKSCNWWIWIMLIIVCLTFIWTVLFMRMFPKR